EGIKDHLTELGWPDPVEVDSGNGRYLLFHVKLPNDESSRELVRLVLHALADEFPGAKIDRSVHNASRLARLPGTWNRKGKDKPDRPHRLARLVAVPDVVQVVTRELLVKLAGHDPASDGKHQGNGRKSKNPFAGKLCDSRARAYVRS